MEIPYIKDRFNIKDRFTEREQRAARNKNGNTYYVPTDMTYHEWYKTYVESDPDWLLQEKKLKNKSADKKQYEEYKAIFGKNEVGSFDYFQNMKYTNNDSWNTLKTKMRELDNKPYDIRINENATAQEVEKEIKLVKETLAEMPKKVKRALKNGTIIDIGNDKGKSGYDIEKDTIIIPKGLEKTHVRHEIGHMVENKMLNPKRVESLKRDILGEIDVYDIRSAIMLILLEKKQGFIFWRIKNLFLSIKEEYMLMNHCKHFMLMAVLNIIEC